jgi:hypothetical protein
LDTCMEVCAAHESVNIANYCAENHRHLGEIWGSHGNKYEDACLLGCGTV